MINDSIRKLMDSCRPQGDDLAQPEMRPLADLIGKEPVVARQLERSRQLDAAIADAVHDVPIPSGLEQRLLVAVSESSAAKPAENSSSTTGLSTAVDRDVSAETLAAETLGAESNHVVLQQGPRRSRTVSRAWLWASLATCAAATVVIACLVPWRSADNVSSHDLVAAALDWDVGQEDWQADRRIWSNHPLPKQMPATGLSGRKKYLIPGYNMSASCYDATLLGGRARIFVFNKTPAFESLPTAPPALPLFTQGKSVAAWTSGKLVYVVVLDGGVEDYKRSIRSLLQVASVSPADANSCPTRTV